MVEKQRREVRRPYGVFAFAAWCVASLRRLLVGELGIVKAPPKLIEAGTVSRSETEAKQRNAGPLSPVSPVSPEAMAAR